jgi:putative transposase
VRFAFIAAQKASSVRLMCRVLDVSASGFYAWKKRPPSVRSQRDAHLEMHVKSSHEKSRGIYGSPRVLEDLQELGLRTSKKRVARLMRRCGIFGARPRAFRATTNSAHDLPVATNVLQREFTTGAPNQAWVTDMTFIRTWQGWLYLAVIIDLFSRRVIGWAASENIDTKLALAALEMALSHRKPATQLVHHSDRGSPYASFPYQRALERNGITCSMSRVGDCWDNAVAESFFATLKVELIHRQAWPTREQAKAAIGEYIEVFYNCRRRHSTLGYVSPVQFEAVYNNAASAA